VPTAMPPITRFTAKKTRGAAAEIGPGAPRSAKRRNEVATAERPKVNAQYEGVKGWRTIQGKRRIITVS
jgi:hypothetical protein